jgi:hypothetical protein
VTDGNSLESLIFPRLLGKGGGDGTNFVLLLEDFKPVSDPSVGLLSLEHTFNLSSKLAVGFAREFGAIFIEILLRFSLCHGDLGGLGLEANEGLGLEFSYHNPSYLWGAPLKFGPPSLLF